MSKSATVSIVTNSFIMRSKLFGFMTTRSPTLFAEAIHAATDVINQLLFKIGEVRSERHRGHPIRGIPGASGRTSATMDAWISIAIGLLLGAMAIMLARLNKEILIDVEDVGIDRDIERVIEAKTGIRVRVASTMGKTSDHVHRQVSPEPADRERS